jgi:hypothetical protein
MVSIKSPWGKTFEAFAASIRDSAIIAAPYITQQPVERLISMLGSRRRSVRLNVLTNLHPDSLIDGSLDIGALTWLCEQVPDATVQHLRYLHAKAYVADGHIAIVTSANLTNGGLWRNHELGIAITEPAGVRDIAEDLREYGNLGVLVPVDAMKDLDALTQEARSKKAAADKSTSAGVKGEHETIRDNMNERLVDLRTAGDGFASDPNGSITAQFADAVLYVLRRHGAMPTHELSPLVRDLKPELCDEDVDRVINGRAFGKRWKHDLRNAQQQLKRAGKIVLENRKWRLVK